MAEISRRYGMSDDILAELRRQNPDLQIDFDEEIFNKALILVEDKMFNDDQPTANATGSPGTTTK